MKNNDKNNIKIFVGVCVIIIAFDFWFSAENQKKNINLIPNTELQIIQEIKEQKDSTEAPNQNQTPLSPTPQKTREERGIPSQFMTSDVPFTSQAPSGNWNELFKEACEEAVVLIVKNFSDGKRDKIISPDFAEQEIQKMVAWQEQNWGGHFDISIDKTAQMAKEIYNIKLRSQEISTIDDIKTMLSQGKIIIAPTTGRELGNPYFQIPGPVYHMIVVLGYDEEYFYTHDVGTKRGAGFKYSHQIIFKAIHDLPSATLTKEELLASPELVNQGNRTVLWLE